MGNDPSKMEKADPLMVPDTLIAHQLISWLKNHPEWCSLNNWEILLPFSVTLPTLKIMSVASNSKLVKTLEMTEKLVKT